MSNKAWRHFHARLHERYDITINHEDWLALRGQLSRAGSQWISRSSLTKSWWLLNIKDQRVVALYCSKSQGFLSVMPLRYLEKALEGCPRRQRYLGIKGDPLKIAVRLKILDRLNLGARPVEQQEEISGGDSQP